MAQNNKTKSEINKKFKSEILKSLLLSEEEKTYWIQSAGTFPQDVQKSMYEVVRNKNLLMQKYIGKAIEENPGLLVELKNKIKEIKLTCIKLEEKKNVPTAEEELVKQLSEL